MSFAHAHRARARLVVVSDRRPVPGAFRTEVEAVIEHAVREHDGIWLVAHEVPGSWPERWSVLDGAPARTATYEWDRYVRWNASYAERTVEMISSGGTIWIYGHRWLLVGAALREHGHRGPVGLLLDTAFPPRDRLEALAWHADVMAALCQLDLIGFLTRACADHFEACCAGRHPPRIDVFSEGAGPAEQIASFLPRLHATGPPGAAPGVL
jgi:hypothetical protein